MRRTTRREFLLAAGSVTVLARSDAATPRPRNGQTRLFSAVPVQRVSAFSGPFIVDKLQAGCPLEVAWEGDRAFVRLDGYALGWLPDPAGRVWRESSLDGQPFEVRVEMAARDERARLKLFVEILSRGRKTVAR